VLLKSAEKAFKDQPEENPELVQFLLQVIDDHLRRDDYDEAYRIAKLMLDAGSTDKRLFPKAGVAAYVTENLDDAKKYLELARQEGTLDERGLNYLREFDEHRAKWNREKEIRAAEAKADDLPRVLLKTNRGDITIELFENEAPNAVANFISLVEDGFYDGLTFHRVLGGFMAQGGCPRGDGSGGPGYNIACECYKPEARHHFRGTLSMAHAGRDTGGSQFFLTFVPTSHLDGRHTVFGRVIEGMDVLPKLRRRDPGNPNAPAPDKIIEAKVLRKRSHPYEPKKVDKG
jgi:cyclophilin family peptidyl-prolyl cis-trans isomerase